MCKDDELRIFSGNSNIPLAKNIASYLKIELSPMDVNHFADGEIFVQIKNNVRGRDCFVIQSTSPNVNTNLMELLIIIDALKRASAGRITAVLPYYGYARQDRKDKPRVPITAKLVADLISSAGTSRVLTMDLHIDQIQGFFNIPVDHLYAVPVFIEEYLKKIKFNVFASPDIGGVARTRAVAKRMKKQIVIIDKRRHTPNKCEVLNIIGNVKGKSIVIYDDILDTCGTVINATNALIANGAKEVRVVGVHGVFSKNEQNRLAKSKIKEVAITNSIAQKDIYDKVKVFDVAPLIGEAILRIHRNKSVSSVFI